MEASHQDLQEHSGWEQQQWRVYVELVEPEPRKEKAKDHVSTRVSPEYSINATIPHFLTSQFRRAPYKQTSRHEETETEATASSTTERANPSRPRRGGTVKNGR